MAGKSEPAAGTRVALIGAASFLPTIPIPWSRLR